MLSDIDAGKVNLIVVKDLSRFGREYAQMGLYVEHYFEENNIRLIAVGENIDTLNGTDNILMPITNVINSLYARDCSRKTKAAHRAIAQSGKFIGSHAPFGYMKDPNDRHHLLVDPEAAEVVRQVFQMFADGIGYVRMTKILRDRNILNPQAYFNQNNPDYYKSDYWRKPFDWHATSIRVILKNRVYLGELVFGKTKNKGFYNKKRIPSPEDEWIVVKNTHEAIISQKLWDTVQKLMESKRQENSSGEIQMFAGLVKCADCGSALSVSYSAKTKKYKSVTCWVYKNYGKERCTSHSIGWKTLGTLVLEDIRRQAETATNHKQRYKELLINASTAKQKQETDKQKRTLKKAEKRLVQLDKILQKLYEDSALERISEERYQSMSEGYEAERAALEAQKLTLSTEISKADKTYENTENFAALISHYTDIKELDSRLLNELIDKIVVHEKVTTIHGEKSQRVDIHYKFVGIIPVELNLAQMLFKSQEEVSYYLLTDEQLMQVKKLEQAVSM